MLPVSLDMGDHRAEQLTDARVSVQADDSASTHAQLAVSNKLHAIARIDLCIFAWWLKML